MDNVPQHWNVIQDTSAPPATTYPVRVDSQKRLTYSNGTAIAPINMGTAPVDTYPSGTLLNVAAGNVNITAATNVVSPVAVLNEYTGTTSNTATLSASVIVSRDASVVGTLGQIQGVRCNQTIVGTFSDSSALTAGTFSNFLGGAAPPGFLSGNCGIIRGVNGIGLTARTPNGNLLFSNPTITRLCGGEFTSWDLQGLTIPTNATGLISTVCGALVRSGLAGNSSLLPTGVVVSNNTALYVQPNDMHAGCVNNASIIINGSASGAQNNLGIWFNTNTSGVANGIVFGVARDTSFWRGGTGQLLTQGDWSSKHYICSSTPTISAGTGAGTAPTITISGTDHGFAISVIPGAGPATSATIATITFGATWPGTAPMAVCSEVNAATASLAVAARPFISTISTTTLTFKSNGTALTAGVLYQWRFVVMH